MYEIVQDLNDVELLADDILIFGCGNTYEEAKRDHDHKLEKLFIRLRNNNCKLNRSKMNLCKKSVQFFGHILTDEGLKPDESKVSAIENFPAPKHKRELQRFIGMVTYLGRYVPNLSTNLTPLRKLTLDTTPWSWSVTTQSIFNNIKKMITNVSTLT